MSRVIPASDTLDIVCQLFSPVIQKIRIVQKAGHYGAGKHTLQTRVLPHHYPLRRGNNTPRRALVKLGLWIFQKTVPAKALFLAGCTTPSPGIPLDRQVGHCYRPDQPAKPLRWPVLSRSRLSSQSEALAMEPAMQAGSRRVTDATFYRTLASKSPCDNAGSWIRLGV